MKKVKVSKKGVRKIVAAVAALLAVVVLCYEIGNFNSSNVKTPPGCRYNIPKQHNRQDVCRAR